MIISHFAFTTPEMNFTPQIAHPYKNKKNVIDLNENQISDKKTLE
jgi:hypothetical protein